MSARRTKVNPYLPIWRLRKSISTYLTKLALKAENGEQDGDQIKAHVPIQMI